MRPMTAAASARSSSVGPSVSPIGTPTIGARRTAASADSAAAMTHT